MTTLDPWDGAEPLWVPEVTAVLAAGAAEELHVDPPR
jgi:hypothetical protein